MDITTHTDALQILMHTDGTVTELLKLLVHEDILVEKVSEKLHANGSLLDRKIFLKGIKTNHHWVFAHSTIYLKNLPQPFVDDLLMQSIPIGSLWSQYRIETYKEMVEQFEDPKCSYLHTRCLCRTYNVFSDRQLIMTITEKFPIDKF